MKEYDKPQRSQSKFNSLCSLLLDPKFARGELQARKTLIGNLSTQRINKYYLSVPSVVYTCIAILKRRDKKIGLIEMSQRKRNNVKCKISS